MLVFDVLCHYSFVDSWSCSFPLVLGTDWFWISCVLAGRFVCHNSVHQVTVKQNMRATVSWQLVLIPSFPSPTHQPHYLSFPVSETTWEWPTTWVVTVNGRSMVQPPFVLCLRIGLLFFFLFLFSFFANWTFLCFEPFDIFLHATCEQAAFTCDSSLHRRSQQSDSTLTVPVTVPMTGWIIIMILLWC